MQVSLMLLSGLLAIGGSPAAGPAGTVTLRNCVVSLDKDVQVPAQQAGLLREITVQAGAAVKADQVVAQIDDALAQRQQEVAEYQLQVADREAKNDTNLKYTEAAMRLAYSEWQRVVKINDDRPGTVPDEEVKRRKLTYERSYWENKQALESMQIATLKRAVAAAELKAAEEGLDRHKIRSLIDGVVQKVSLHAGEWVQPGDPVLRIIQMDSLRVEGSIDASKYSQGRIDGKPVTVRVKHPDEGLLSFKGTVIFVSDEVLIGGERKVRAEVENRKGDVGRYYLLSPGMAAEMTIDLNKPVSRVGGE
jgi:multidrug resistance efflux pump